MQTDDVIVECAIAVPVGDVKRSFISCCSLPSGSWVPQEKAQICAIQNRNMHHTPQCYNLTFEEHIRYALFIPFSSYCYSMANPTVMHVYHSHNLLHNNYLMNCPE